MDMSTLFSFPYHFRFHKIPIAVLISAWTAVLSFVFLPKLHAHSYSSEFTSGEHAYLDSIGPITLCIDPDWRPFEYLNEEGEYSGISAELIRLISERTGIEFRVLTTTNWDESLRLSKEGKCMALSFLNQTTQRNNWLIFSDIYFSEPNVIISREDHTDIPDLSDVSGLTMALPTGTSIEEKVRKSYPGVRILLFATEEESIQAVNDRKADITLRSMTMAAHVIKSQGLFNLKIAGQLPEFKNEFRMGISNHYPQLKEILNKGIATLTTQDIQNAISKHVSITVVDTTNYTPALLFGAVVLVLFTIGLIWNYQLRKLNKQLKSSKDELIALSEQQERDIAERKIIEQKLHEREQQLSNLISNLPGFIYRCVDDDAYTMKYISSGCYKITGYLPSDFVNNTTLRFVDIILPEELTIIRSKWVVALEEKSHFEHEYKIRHANGSIRWIWERGYVNFDEASQLRVMDGFISDITDRKVAEAVVHNNEEMLREINAQKDKFFSIIAHDLRSPFTAIVGFSELLAKRVEKKDLDGIEEYVELILKSSKKTLDLLMNLLEWARSQTGKISFNPEYLDLQQILNETLFVMDNIACRKAIIITKNLPANMPVFADRHMLGTILRNLVSNAIKFTPEGGSITIKALRTENHTFLSVSDTGTGIPANRTANLFRIDTNTSTLGTADEEGTGLGLILCKEFIDKHGGTIQVESQPGEGSKFTISLPLRL